MVGLSLHVGGTVGNATDTGCDRLCLLDAVDQDAAPDRVALMERGDNHVDSSVRLTW
jgi:hypothetical protein